MSAPLLTVEGLRKQFPAAGGPLRRGRGVVRAVDGVTVAIDAGRTLALVGESGCGKTTVARCILRLTEPTAGRICFRGDDIATFDARRLRAYRQQVQIVFQDPFGSLNPRMSAEDLVAEPLRAHRLVDGGRAARRESHRLLELVGLAAAQAGRYPHEFSGGQRQRIAIARALSLQPALLVLDEPVAALDVSIAAQVLNLLGDLQAELGVAYLLISHDLSVVRHVADQVAVMYLGALMETADATALFAAPCHPYTQALLSALPLPDPARERRRERIPLPGEVPSVLQPPCACRFHPRCFKAEPVCRRDEPPLAPAAADAHRAACWFAEPVEVLASRGC